MRRACTGGAAGREGAPRHEHGLAPAMLLAAAMLAPAATANAAPTVVVSDALSGRSLPRVAIFEDPTAELTIEEVSSPRLSHAFELSEDDSPSFGLTSSAYWVRFTAENRGAAPRRWLFEVAHPPLDHVELFVPRPQGGFEARKTGDRLPFRQRDIAYRTFLFELEEPPGTRTYYLRVQTSGSASLPMQAWTQQSFRDHLLRSLPLTWIFYGLMIVMAAYNLFVFVSVRERTYLYYVCYIVSFVGFQFSLEGLAYQYLWPNQPLWNEKVLVLSIGLAFSVGLQFMRDFLNLRADLPRADRYARACVAISLALALASPLVGYAVAIRVLVVWGVHIIVLGLYIAVATALRGSRSARFYLAAWLFLLIGLLIYLLQTLGVLPTTFLGQWSLQLGAAIEVTLLSLGLADRINVMRGNLQLLNLELAQNVSRLKVALEQAQAATRAKGQFLASVSHELRTPLNAIINIPEGLLEEFRPAGGVRCEQCGQLFALEPGEQPDFDQPCPECHQAGSLRAHAVLAYHGQPESTVRHLKHVHTASKHLLDVVSSILDFSKLEASRMELNVSDIDLLAVLHDALSPLGQLARQKGVELVLPAQTRGAPLRGDRVRIAQILLNLVGNAIKFSEKRGAVRVEVEDEGDAYAVHVRDRGIGIAPEDRERIFESFSQVDASNTRQFGGTGLGLAISKQLTELHGGTIGVDSVLGQGSTFSVRLPKRGPQIEPSEPTPRIEARTPARTSSWAPPPELGQP